MNSDSNSKECLPPPHILKGLAGVIVRLRHPGGRRPRPCDRCGRLRDFPNSGQICVSTDRIIIDQSVIDAFNDTEYGLAGRVISHNFAAAQDVVSPIRSAAIHINGQGIADEPIAPLGGVKGSCHGVFAGTESFTPNSDGSPSSTPGVPPIPSSGDTTRGRTTNEES